MDETDVVILAGPMSNHMSDVLECLQSEGIRAQLVTFRMQNLREDRTGHAHPEGTAIGGQRGTALDEQGVPSLWNDTFPEGVDLPEMSNNKQFKETFPQPGHQSYSKSYEWDLKGVVVELNTEELDVMLKTSVAPPAFHHMAKYSLRSEDERNELFEA